MDIPTTIINGKVVPMVHYHHNPFPGKMKERVCKCGVVEKSAAVNWKRCRACAKKAQKEAVRRAVQAAKERRKEERR